MNEQKFQSLGRMAKSMQRIDHDRSDFWRGFQRGIRRLHHGENFGTAEEHERWMNCARDEYRKQLQTGYRVGYHYDDLKIESENDIQPMRKMLGLSVVDVAEIAGVSPRTIEGWEQGRPMSRLAIRQLRRELLIG
jgi:DNA-binding XRE family transcriptional regulator